MSQEVSQSEVAEVTIQADSHEEDYGAQALAELNELIAQCGDEIVESPRLPGVPLPLRALMNACPEPPTAENAHKFLAEARSLLEAARNKKLENPEEAEEEGPLESEAKKKLN
jgi:hypothetical protein